MTQILLQTEENVLAQEAVLDALLNSESQHQQWMWDEEIRAGGVCLHHSLMLKSHRKMVP